jgi:hypothetical protein
MGGVSIWWGERPREPKFRLIVRIEDARPTSCNQTDMLPAGLIIRYVFKNVATKKQGVLADALFVVNQNN